MSVFSDSEIKGIIERWLQHRPFLSEEEILFAIGELEGMRVQGTLCDLVLDGRLDIDVQEGQVVFNHPDNRIRG